MFIFNIITKQKKKPKNVNYKVHFVSLRNVCILHGQGQNEIYEIPLDNIHRIEDINK